MNRWIHIILVAVLSLSVVGADGEEPSASARKPVDKPFKTTLTMLDKTRLAGTVSAWDETGFELLNDKKEPREVRWSDLDAKQTFAIYARILEKGSAEQWLGMGRMLLGMTEGKEWAEKAFARALRIDPAVKERIEQIKSEAAQNETKEDADPDEQQADGDGAGAATAGPQTIGEADEKFWGKLTDEQHAEAVAELKAFGDETRKTLGVPIHLLETKFFLFYSDLPTEEARNWAGLLDRMYARLCNLFAIDKSLNIWRGKALIFVFQKREDYQDFQRAMHKTDPMWSAGMCHNYGNGTVHIAFYRQPKELEFARVLVHESVHGFLHRYRKPVHIPSWANEGLAEVIAQELVPMPGHEQRVKNRARDGLQEFGGLRAEFFNGGQIEPWQYPVAQTYCEFMIVNNKKGYVAFVNGIKDGLDWQESMKQHYGADPDRVTRAYLEWMGYKQQQQR